VGVNALEFEVLEVEESVLLSWTAPPGPVQGFHLYRNRRGSDDTHKRLNRKMIDGHRYIDRSVQQGITYIYRLGVCAGSDEHYHGPVEITVSGKRVTGYAAFTLNQNVPNPFNPLTTITFTIPSHGGNQMETAVSLRIYNVKGQLVRLLLNGKVPPGLCSVIWNGRGERGDPLPGGIYFCRLTAAAHEETKKMILLK
jgi:hypothetical protein